MKYVFLLTMIAFFFLSCKKDLNYTRIAGKVINIGSKQPIDSVLVILQDGVASDFFGTPGNTSSDRKNLAYTDKNGYFDVELEGEHRAYIGFKKDKYLYEYDEGGSVIGIKPYPEGTFLNEVFEMEAEAFFNGIFVNKQPNENDSLYLNVYTTYYWSSDWLLVGTGPFRPFGEYEDEGYLATGDKFSLIKLRFTRNNKWYTKIDSVYIKSLEI